VQIINKIVCKYINIQCVSFFKQHLLYKLIVEYGLIKESPYIVFVFVVVAITLTILYISKEYKLIKIEL